MEKLWISRNKYGKLELWKHKPRKKYEGYFADGFYLGELHYIFKEITFENSPQQIEIKVL